MTKRAMTKRATLKRKPAAQRTESGRAAFKRGHGIERRAAWWLRLKLYRVIAINWRSRAGEVDLIAKRGDTLAFIEVKQRNDTDAATLSLRPQQQQRLARAAALFCAQRPEYAACTIRFDLIAFGRFGSPIHMKDAWRPG